MNAEEKNRYFQELTLNLQHEGFAVKPETEEGLLPIELDGQRLCLALDTGSVRYWREDTADDHRSAALDKAISITKTTAEYMRQMETAPQLTASGLTGDYRLLADFNDVVLAGHPTRYGVQFATWERVRERTGLNAGKYDYARLAAYIPGMRDIVNAQMDRAADFIIRWGTENTTSGSWCVYFEDLEEHA